MTMTHIHSGEVEEPLSYRLLTIQSHVACGYVGNRSATFPSQLLGWDVDAVNTVQFSNHTGYGRWGGQRMDAAHITGLLEAIESNGLLRQNRVLTGYTPSPEALCAVEAFIRKLREQKPDMIYLLDPVMGDMDRGMYVNADVLPVYRRMLPLSTIICPNQYEAQVLADENITCLDSLYRVLEKLHTVYKVPHVVITSLDLPPADLAKLGVEPTMSDGKPTMLLVGSSWTGHLSPWFLTFPSQGEYFSGVGDLFAALVLARFAEHAHELPEAARTPLSDIPPSSKEECALPISHAVMLAVASLQHVLTRTRATMEAEGARLGLDPFAPAHKASVEDRVQIMRMRELKIIQSAPAILQPQVQYRPRWMPAS